MSDLVEFMSKNAHENWAKQKMADGYKHASNEQIRDAKMKLERRRMRNPNGDTPKEPLFSPMLVPYEDLKEEDKEKNRSTVRATIKTILFLGFVFEAPIHTIDLASLTTQADSLQNRQNVPAHHHQVIEDPNGLREASSGMKDGPGQAARLPSLNVRRSQLESEADDAIFHKQELDGRKGQLLDMYLMAAARNNDPEIIDMLVRADEGR